jgi:hypothetical protein
MGFLKGLGKVTGHVIGGTVGGALEVIGELADSDSLKKAGKGVSLKECQKRPRLNQK